MATRSRRQKISTTIALENDAYLKSLVKRGKAANLGEAIDHSVRFARRAEARKKLEEATAAFYASLSGEALREEKKLERAVSTASKRVKYDAE